MAHYVKNLGRQLTRTIAPELGFEVPMKKARVRGRIDLLLKAENGGPRPVSMMIKKGIQFRGDLQRWLERIRAGELPRKTGTETCHASGFTRLCGTKSART